MHHVSLAWQRLYMVTICNTDILRLCAASTVNQGLHRILYLSTICGRNINAGAAE